MRLLVALIVVALVGGTALAQREQDEESQLLVEEAKRALGKKDYTRAGSLLDKALAAAPRRLDIYILRASVHGIVGKHEAAVDLLERARRLAPDNVRVLTALGTELVQVGRAKDGVPMLERIVTTDRARYDAQVVLGHYYVKQGAWGDANTAFTAYFAHRPKALAGEDPIHRLGHANALLRGGDAKSALALYRQVLERDGKSELARLGVGWATAAISCKNAAPILEGLSDLETKYAEVSLVRGRCALMLGKLDEALARAERYRKAAPGVIAGQLLLGDVRAAQNNWKEAEAAYRVVADKNPDDRLIALKLGRAERLLGKAPAAVERLHKAGPPKAYEDDWTLEYGEALLATRDGEKLRELLTPWIQSHQGHATGEFLYGHSLVLANEHAAAVAHLEVAVQKREPRAARLLVETLNTLAVAAIKKKELPEATKLLERAVTAGGSPQVTRNLGAVLLAQEQHARALAVLEKAGDAPTLHLLARAYHGAKRYDEARATYSRAVRLYGKDPRVVATLRDLAAAEVAAGRAEEAITVLDQAVAAAPAGSKKELETARLAAARNAATEAMRAGRFAVAVKVLRSVEKSAEGEGLTQLRCDLALAATGATQRDVALDILRGLEKAKARCPFAAPADELGVPILIAWNTDTRNAKAALARLDGLRRKATGPAEPLLRQAGSDIALRAATDAYASGNLKAASTYLATARSYDKRTPELQHNQAVLDIASGSVDGAISALAALTGEVPEARINLGVAYERKGDAEKALAMWKAALGSTRFAPLKDWIERKERFWGSP